MRAAAQAALQPLLLCWQLRDDIRNHQFLRNASGFLTGGGALGTSLWGATHSGDDLKNGLMVGGGATALGATGFAHQSYHIARAQDAFLANRCPELIAENERASTSVWAGRLSARSQSSFSEVVPKILPAMPGGAFGLTVVDGWPTDAKPGEWWPVDITITSGDGTTTEITFGNPNPTTVDVENWLNGIGDMGEVGNGEVSEGSMATMMIDGYAPGYQAPELGGKRDRDFADDVLDALDVIDGLVERGKRRRRKPQRVPVVSPTDVVSVPGEADGSRTARVADLCLGAAVLTRGCTPPRTLPHVYEYSTDVKDIQRQQLIIGGVLMAPAVALYGIPAGLSALAGWGEGVAALLNGARPLAESL